MRAVFTLALSTYCAFAASAPIREIVSECPEGPICQVRNGWSFNFNAGDRVPLVYGPDGRFRFPLSFQVPGTDVSSANDVAVDPDGSFVVAVTGRVVGRPLWREFGLVMFDSTGLRTSFIDTGDFQGEGVAIASDHSVWVLGSEYTGSKEHEDYAVLRKYSRTGELLGAFLNRSTFPPGLAPGWSSSGTSLFAAGDRIAVMAHSGTGYQRELIELDLDGNVVGRMRFDNRRYPYYAFTSAGVFYAGSGDPSSTILQLDPVTGRQREVESPGIPWTLYGAEGPDLLYRARNPDGHLRMGWFPEPKP